LKIQKGGRKIEFRYPRDIGQNYIKQFAEANAYPLEKKPTINGMLIKYVLTTSDEQEMVLNLYLNGKGNCSSLLVERGDCSVVEELLGFITRDIPIKKPRIGIDEAGKGDYFGPLVIAAVGVTGREEIKLKAMGVTDSKTINDKKILEISSEIIKLCPHDIITITPQKYNELYKKFNNLNRLLAWGHSRALENVLKKGDFPLAISDKFSSKGLVQKALFEKGKKIELVERHYAEDDVAVAAASILARAEFLRGLNKLSKISGVKLPKGASNKVIEVGVVLVDKFGAQKLSEYAKLHFKTTERILSK